jgi:hypothetical protein
MRRSPHPNLQDRKPHPASLTPHTKQNRAKGTAGKPAFAPPAPPPMRISDSYPHHSRNPRLMQGFHSLGYSTQSPNSEKDFQLHWRPDASKPDPDEIFFTDSQGIEKKLISIDKKIKIISGSTIIDETTKSTLIILYKSIAREGIHYIDDNHCNTSNPQPFNPQDLPHILKAMTKVTEYDKKFISTFDKLKAEFKETKPLPAPVPVQPLPALAQVKTTQPAQTKTVRFVEDSQYRARSSRGGQGAFNPSHTLQGSANTQYHFPQTQGDAFAMTRSAKSNSTFATSAPDTQWDAFAMARSAKTDSTSVNSTSKSPPKPRSPIQSATPITQDLGTTSPPKPPTSSNQSPKPTQASQNQDGWGLWGSVSSAVSSLASWSPLNHVQTNKKEENFSTPISSLQPPSSATLQTPSPTPKPISATEISQVIEDIDLSKSFSKKADKITKQSSQEENKYLFNQLTVALGKKPEINSSIFSWFSNPATSEPSLLEKVLTKLLEDTKDKIKETLSKFLDSEKSIEIPADELKKLQTKILEFRKSPRRIGSSLNKDKETSEYDEVLFLLQLRINGKSHYLEQDFNNFKEKITEKGIDEALKVAKSTSNVTRLSEIDAKTAGDKPIPAPTPETETSPLEIFNPTVEVKNKFGNFETQRIQDFRLINGSTSKKELRSLVRKWIPFGEESCKEFLKKTNGNDNIDKEDVIRLRELTRELSLDSLELAQYHFALASTYFNALLDDNSEHNTNGQGAPLIKLCLIPILINQEIEHFWQMLN